MIVTREEGAKPIKAWLGTKEVVIEGFMADHTVTVIDVEDAALQQTKNIARLPFIAPQGVALMPDAHLGKGATAWLKRKGIQADEIFTKEGIKTGSANVGDGALSGGAPWVKPEVLYPLIRKAHHPLLRSVSKRACSLISEAVKSQEDGSKTSPAEAPTTPVQVAPVPSQEASHSEPSIIEDLLHALRAQNAVIARLLKTQGTSSVQTL